MLTDTSTLTSRDDAVSEVLVQPFALVCAFRYSHLRTLMLTFEGTVGDT